jgi:hypothetical protein
MEKIISINSGAGLVMGIIRIGAGSYLTCTLLYMLGRENSNVIK